ncbi:undecaprenyldiphospho-muramoylpentapeptide beta-N- acetylglucosaminyltransferase [compost metagenome]
MLIQQRDLTPQKLAGLMASFDRAKLVEMANKARALGKPDAARVVAQRCMQLAEMSAA